MGTDASCGSGDTLSSDEGDVNRSFHEGRAAAVMTSVPVAALHTAYRRWAPLLPNTYVRVLPSRPCVHSIIDGHGACSTIKKTILLLCRRIPRYLAPKAIYKHHSFAEEMFVTLDGLVSGKAMPLANDEQYKFANHPHAEICRPYVSNATVPHSSLPERSQPRHLIAPYPNSGVHLFYASCPCEWGEQNTQRWYAIRKPMQCVPA